MTSKLSFVKVTTSFFYRLGIATIQSR